MTTRVTVTNCDANSPDIRVRNIAWNEIKVPLERKVDVIPGGGSLDLWLSTGTELVLEEVQPDQAERAPREVEDIEQFFAYGHLPALEQQVSRPFCELARHIVTTLPRNAERSVALRKVLEAKDAAVRAHLAKAKA